MKQVHFVHAGHAYLPELQAYAAHLARLGHTSHVHTRPYTVPEQADVVWWMCGRVDRAHSQRLHRSLQVHEYASASVGHWPATKDMFKRWLHPRPDHRVFQSEWVRQRMGFDDDVAWSLRDMAVPGHFLRARREHEPDVDLVYLGEMRRLLEFVPVLHALLDAGLRLLLVGQAPEALLSQLAGRPGLLAYGPVPQEQVPAQLLRARAGLNLMPARLPLTQQTSTKVLEYMAVGLPVISNPYPWIERYAHAHPQRLLLVDDLLSASSWQALSLRWPGLDAQRTCWQGLTWEQCLQDMPLWRRLELA